MERKHRWVTIRHGWHYLKELQWQKNKDFFFFFVNCNLSLHKRKSLMKLQLARVETFRWIHEVCLSHFFNFFFFFLSSQTSKSLIRTSDGILNLHKKWGSPKKKKKSIFKKSREDNWLSIKTTLVSVPTLVSAGDERRFKLGSCSDILPLSCHLKTQLPKFIETCRKNSARERKRKRQRVD